MGGPSLFAAAGSRVRKCHFAHSLRQSLVSGFCAADSVHDFGIMMSLGSFDTRQPAISEACTCHRGGAPAPSLYSWLVALCAPVTISPLCHLRLCSSAIWTTGPLVAILACHAVTMLPAAASLFMPLKVRDLRVHCRRVNYGLVAAMRAEAATYLPHVEPAVEPVLTRKQRREQRLANDDDALAPLALAAARARQLAFARTAVDSAPDLQPAYLQWAYCLDPSLCRWPPVPRQGTLEGSPWPAVTLLLTSFPEAATIPLSRSWLGLTRLVRQLDATACGGGQASSFTATAMPIKPSSGTTSMQGDGSPTRVGDAFCSSHQASARRLTYARAAVVTASDLHSSSLQRAYHLDPLVRRRPVAPPPCSLEALPAPCVAQVARYERALSLCPCFGLGTPFAARPWLVLVRSHRHHRAAVPTTLRWKSGKAEGAGGNLPPSRPLQPPTGVSQLVASALAALLLCRLAPMPATYRYSGKSRGCGSCSSRRRLGLI